MPKSNKKTSIDYLFEDPPIQNQQFALVSIVGPHMNQKCDVWGLKVRGTAENLDKAKALSKKILQVDNHYDIYTVEVGKFFPLAVEPTQISNIEYQNEQLNQLMKSYLQNKESASDFWHQRKNEMVQDAIKEGKSSEFANQPEHPISVLHRINNYQTQLKEMQDNISELQEELQSSREKFDTYTQEERDQAYKHIQQENLVSNGESQLPTIQEIGNEETIEEQILNDPAIIENETIENETIENETIENETETKKETSLNEIINKINNLEIEIQEFVSLKNTLTPSDVSYKKIEENILNSENELKTLKDQLNNKDLVNNYINENYPNPQSYNF